MTATTYIPTAVVSRPSPAWHFTLRTPVRLDCDLCPWEEWFEGGSAASVMLSALYSHHAFACPALVGNSRV